MNYIPPPRPHAPNPLNITVPPPPPHTHLVINDSSLNRWDRALVWILPADSVHVWAATWQNQQNGLCAQRRLRSAWASAQSDQSLRCPLSGKLRTQTFFMRTAKNDQTGRTPRLIWVFAGRTSVCLFCHEVAQICLMIWSSTNFTLDLFCTTKFSRDFLFTLYHSNESNIIYEFSSPFSTKF